MNNSSHLEIQEAELLRLLEQADDDVIVKSQLLEMLKEIEEDVKVRPPVWNQADLPRTAIFFRGGGVINSDGIRPSLAGEALIQYEKMYKQQAIFDEQEAAKDAGKLRRPRGVSEPELLFTGTPRGSFGLEFMPVGVTDPALQKSRASSLETVTTALNNVIGSSDDTIDDAIEKVVPAVLPPMRAFIKALSKHGAELRLVYNNKPTIIYGSKQVQIAYERLDREVIEVEEEIGVVFRGLTFLSSHFDVMTESGEYISGIISEEMPEKERMEIYKRVDQKFTVVLRKTTIKTVSKPVVTYYVLLRAKD